jgi:hypothetical protein
LHEIGLEEDMDDLINDIVSEGEKKGRFYGAETWEYRVMLRAVLERIRNLFNSAYGFPVYRDPKDPDYVPLERGAREIALFELHAMVGSYAPRFPIYLNGFGLPAFPYPFNVAFKHIRALVAKTETVVVHALIDGSFKITKVPRFRPFLPLLIISIVTSSLSSAKSPQLLAAA